MDSLPNFLTNGAPLRARFAHARAPLIVVKFHCVKQKNRQNVQSLRVIKQPKMVDFCFGALALNAE